jgi:predicted small metal-binding protein
MAKLIKCACGYAARGETDDDVVGDIEQHMVEDHPDLADKVTREDIQGWIEET